MTLKGSGKPQPFSSKPLRSWQERNFACGKNRFGRPVVGFKSIVRSIFAQQNAAHPFRAARADLETRNVRFSFRLLPPKIFFRVGKSRVFILPKDDISVNSIFSGRTLILHPAFSSKGRLCPNYFAGRPQFGQSALFPFNRRFDQRENPPK